MPRLSATGEDAAADAVATLVTHISLHSADTSTTGANELSGSGYARVAVSWTASSGGSGDTNTGAVTLNVPASKTAAFWGGWTASTGGTFIVGGPMTPTVTTGGSAGTAPFAIGALVIPAS